MKKIEELAIDSIPGWFKRINPKQLKRKITFRTFNNKNIIRGDRLKKLAEDVLKMLEDELLMNGKFDHKDFEIGIIADEGDENEEDDQESIVISKVKHQPETDQEYLERYKKYIEQKIKHCANLEKEIQELLK